MWGSSSLKHVQERLYFESIGGWNSWIGLFVLIVVFALILLPIVGRVLGSIVSRIVHRMLKGTKFRVAIGSINVIPLRVQELRITFPLLKGGALFRESTWVGSGDGNSTNQDVEIVLRRVRISTHMMRYIATFGHARLLTFAVKGLEVNVNTSAITKQEVTHVVGSPLVSEKKRRTGTRTSGVTTMEPPAATTTTAPPPPSPSPSPSKPIDDEELTGGNRLVSSILLHFEVEIRDVVFSLHDPALDHALTLSLPKTSFEFQPSAVIHSASVFLANLGLESIILSWKVKATEEELLQLRGITLSLELRYQRGLLLPQQGSLLDFMIGGIFASPSLHGLTRLMRLAQLLRVGLGERGGGGGVVVDEPSQQQEGLVPVKARTVPAWIHKIDLPKVRVRLPLINLRVLTPTHVILLEGDVTFNGSLVAQGRGSPVVVTGEAGINLTLDGLPHNARASLNPLARLSGLHCFLQHSFGGRTGESVFDLKLTTTGIMVYLVPDHARAALLVWEVIFDALPPKVKRRKMHRRGKAVVGSSSAAPALNVFRYHLSASLNSIGVNLMHTRDAEALLVARLETPTVSLIGGGNTMASALIMQSTFLDVTAAAFHTDRAMECLPSTDRVLSVEALGLRGDASELALSAKAASLQVGPALLTSLLPLFAALPLEEMAAFARKAKEQEKKPAGIPPSNMQQQRRFRESSRMPIPLLAAKREASVFDEEPIAMAPNVSFVIGSQVQIHIADLASNQGSEVSIVTLMLDKFSLQLTTPSQAPAPAPPPTAAAAAAATRLGTVTAAGTAPPPTSSEDDDDGLRLGQSLSSIPTAVPRILQIVFSSVTGLITRHRPTSVESVPRVFPPFFSLLDFEFFGKNLHASKLHLEWSPEAHLIMVELFGSFVCEASAYKKAVSSISLLGGKKMSSPRPRASQPPIMQKGLRPLRPSPPEFSAQITDVQINALFTMHSAMRVRFEMMHVETKPAITLHLSNAEYFASLSRDFVRILEVPELRVSLGYDPRSVVQLGIHIKKPHWALPYKFHYGAVVDEMASCIKAIVAATKETLVARGVITGVNSKSKGRAAGRRHPVGAKGKEEMDAFSEGEEEDEEEEDEEEEFVVEGDDDEEDSARSRNSGRNLREKPARFVLSLSATVTEPIFDLMDNPFEVHLATAYRVRADELAEIALREELLGRKVAKFRRAGTMSEAQYVLLMTALARENSRIFCQRVRESLKNAPQFVHRISAPSVKLGLSVDLRPQRLKKRLRRLNKQSRFFSDTFSYKFDVLVGLRVTAQVPHITLQHRDLPNPWIEVNDATINMNVILAEELAPPKCDVHWTILPSATRVIKGRRTATGIKFYHDIHVKCSSFSYTMGTAQDWYQRAFVHAFTTLPPENINVSQLNWWDKMRYQFHGLLEIRADKVRWSITGTLNPYEVANYLLIAGDSVLFSYKTNELHLGANLMEFSVSTQAMPFFASRDFSLDCHMKWTSLGDPENFLVFPRPSWKGLYTIDASDETQSPPWNATLDPSVPDPFDFYRSTSLVWSFDLKVAPPTPTGDIVSLDTAFLRWMMKWLKTKEFPDMKIRPPIPLPTRGGTFGGVIKALRLRLRATHFNIAYWESREVRDPTGFKASVAALDVATGIEKGSDGWDPVLGSVRAEGIESLMFPPEDYARFYDTLKATGNEAAMQFPGTHLAFAPSLLLVQEKRPNTDQVLQHFTIKGLRFTLTPPTTRLISSWSSAYSDWSLQKEGKVMAQQQEEEGGASASVAAAAAAAARNRGETMISPRELVYRSAGPARTVNEQQALDDDNVETFFARHEASLAWLIEVKDAQIKLVTIVPEGAALLVAEDLEIRVANNDDEQRFFRVMWKEYELYCSGRIDLWLDRMAPSSSLFRILTKCTMEFDYFTSPEELVRHGGAEALGSFFITAPSLLAHMSAYHFNILRAVFSKFFVVQTSMSEQHKEKLANIQYKLQLAPETVGDVRALRVRVRNLALEIKDLQSKVRDLELEAVQGQGSPIVQRRRAGVVRGGDAREVRKKEKPRGEKKLFNVCQHCGEAFTNEVEIVEVDEVPVHARCVVPYRTALADAEPSSQHSIFGPSTRISELKRRLLQKQKTYQASTELLGLLTEAQKKVRQGANALPTWKLRVSLDSVEWHMFPSHNNVKEGAMFCQIMLRHLTASSLLREDDSGIIRMEINRVSILNHLPGTTSKYLEALQPLKAATWSDRDTMIRLFAAMRSPVGGIVVFDHFELNIAPLRVSITGDLYEQLFRYLFDQTEEEQEQTKQDKQRRLSNSNHQKAAEANMSIIIPSMGTLGVESARHRHYTDFQIRSNGEVYYSYGETDYVRMRQRAEEHRMFIYWKLTDVALLLTFKKGFSFENLKLVLHAKEFHACAWSWGELVRALKKDVIGDVLGQTGNFIKHVFTPRSANMVLADEVQLRPKSKLQQKLEDLGSKASEAITTVTGGIVQLGGRERMMEEDREKLRETLIITEGTLDALPMYDYTTEGGAGGAMQEIPTDLEKKLTELKAELLLGNAAKREQERQRLRKKNRREERRRKSVQLEQSISSSALDLHAQTGVFDHGSKSRGAQPMTPITPAVTPASGARLRRAPFSVPSSSSDATKNPPKITIQEATPPTIARRRHVDVPSPDISPIPLHEIRKGPIAKLKEEL